MDTEQKSRKKILVTIIMVIQHLEYGLSFKEISPLLAFNLLHVSYMQVTNLQGMIMQYSTQNYIQSGHK